MKNWLSEKEQYQEILNNEQISRIRDRELREIRMRHWEYGRKIFLDEENISDEEFCRLSIEDAKKEKEEIEKYREKLKK